MKPPGGTSATGLGALSNAEFHGINPAYSYADIVDFAASLPTMPSGIAAEYKYERDRSSDGVNTARSFSLNHEQTVSSALANSIAVGGIGVDYEGHGLPMSNINSSNNSNGGVRAGSVAKTRARLSSPAKRARKKSKKDPDAPKHPMSAFLYYLTSERPRLAGHLGDMSIGQQTKIIAKRWKTLDETDKEPWERLAKNDKDRYARERREYHGETRQSATPVAPH
ncbi:high mobility group [Coemansia sp. RSA 2559]|nr:high mobility group [Coemansia sp. RSA 2559]